MSEAIRHPRTRFALMAHAGSLIKRCRAARRPPPVPFMAAVPAEEPAGGEYDAVIVGARVAGSSLAILLGRQGWRVLLVDRDRFPSDTLSTHLLQPPAVTMLAELGALGAVEATGVRRITRQRTYIGDCVVEGSMRLPPPAYALCVRRDRLDAILIRRALAHPSVAFRERTRTEGLLWEDGRVMGVRLRGADGALETVRARVVVGADGKHSQVAAWAGATRYEEVPALRPMYYGYYRNVEPLPETANEVFFQDGRTGYLLPMEPGMDCLVLELRPDEFPAFRADPAGRFEAAFRALPDMERRLAQARRDGPIHGTRGVENYLRVPYGPGWALTGDAAYLKDPSTGTGIEDAFRGSYLLAEALDAALGGADWEATLADFHRRRDERVLPAYRATLAFTQANEVPDDALGWLQAVLANPGVTREFARSLPILATTPGAFPSAMQAAVARAAGGFAAAAAPQQGRRAA